MNLAHKANKARKKIAELKQAAARNVTYRPNLTGSNGEIRIITGGQVLTTKKFEPDPVPRWTPQSTGGDLAKRASNLRKQIAAGKHILLCGARSKHGVLQVRTKKDGKWKDVHNA